MKVVVTGASGAVGRRLCRDLEAHGHHVTRLGRIATPSTSVVATTYEIPDLRQHLTGADAAVHLAWRRSPSDLLKDFYPSLAATENLLVACSEEGVGRVVGASSISVYSGPLPWRETDLPRPTTKYGLSKAIGEELLRLAATSRLSTTALRIGHVYTDDETNSYAVNTFIDLASRGLPIVVTGDRDRRRDMVYAGEVSRAIQLSLTTQDAPPVVNVGSGSPVSSAEIAAAAAQAFGCRSRVERLDEPAGGAGSTQLCTELAAQSIRYVPTTSLDDAMRDIAARRSQIR